MKNLIKLLSSNIMVLTIIANQAATLEDILVKGTFVGFNDKIVRIKTKGGVSHIKRNIVEREMGKKFYLIKSEVKFYIKTKDYYDK
jgi:hypothetical protein